VAENHFQQRYFQHFINLVLLISLKAGYGGGLGSFKKILFELLANAAINVILITRCITGVPWICVGND
jgi:hypothetical protein